MTETDMAWRGWRFHPRAGMPKHGPTLDKPQTKVWRADGSFWALLVREEKSAEPELTIFELIEGNRWRDTGTVVARDDLTTADAQFDGTYLWIATRAPIVGLRLQRLTYDPPTRTFLNDSDGVWQHQVETPSVSVAVSHDGTVFVAFTADAKPFVTSGRADHFPELDPPRPLPTASPTLIPVDLGALVPLGEEMGFFWSDQGQQAFHFAISSQEGQWRFEEPASGDRVADDHVACRTYNGRLYVTVKTSRNDEPDRPPADSLIVLFVRESDGSWSHHHVVDVSEPVTRPIPVVDPQAGLIHVLYTYGPNPGERSIRMKTATLEELKFPAGPGEVLIADPGAEINDVSGARETMTDGEGSLVLASDGKNGHYYFAQIGSRNKR